MLKAARFVLAAFLLVQTSIAIACATAVAPVQDAAVPCHDSGSTPAQDSLCATHCAAAAPIAHEGSFLAAHDGPQALPAVPVVVGEGIRVPRRAEFLPEPAPPPRTVPRRILLHSFLV
jgi:hypothetical protein